MLIYLSLLVALTGLVVYILATNQKIMELAIVAYGAGLLAFLLQVANGRVVGIMR